MRKCIFLIITNVNGNMQYMINYVRPAIEKKEYDTWKKLADSLGHKSVMKMFRMFAQIAEESPALFRKR